MHAAAVRDVEVLEANFDRGLPAHSRPAHDCGALGKLRRQFDSGILESVARRHDGELREAVNVIFLARLEVLGGIEAAYLRGVGKSQNQRMVIHTLNRPDRGLALAHRVPRFRHSQSQRTDDSHSRDCHAARRHILVSAFRSGFEK
jgi:hypothetical protein